MVCYTCGQELNDQNRSKEHIINNSIGGQISSTTLLCITCNSKFGETIDAELNNQLSSIATVLGIKKNRLPKKEARVKLIKRKLELQLKLEKAKGTNKI